MSHANVYRHFASKAALQEAVAARWLHRISDPLAVIAESGGDAAARLEAWVLALTEAKRRKVLDDPEMFATYHALAEAARAVVDAHVTELTRQLAMIVRDGAAAGAFMVRDAGAAARVVLGATMRFHHPHFVQAGIDEADLRATLRLLLAGLRSGVV